MTLCHVVSMLDNALKVSEITLLYLTYHMISCKELARLSGACQTSESLRPPSSIELTTLTDSSMLSLLATKGVVDSINRDRRLVRLWLNHRDKLVIESTLVSARCSSIMRQTIARMMSGRSAVDGSRSSADLNSRMIRLYDAGDI